MLSKRHIHVDRIENVEITLESSPFVLREVTRLLKKSYSGLPNPVDIQINLPQHIKVLDMAGKVLSLIAGLAVMVFIILSLTGVQNLGNVKIGTLLSIFSFTLFGSLISVGGVKLFSMSVNLNKLLSQSRSGSQGCPFIPIVDEKTMIKYNIESPFVIGDSDFCHSGCCHLVDHHGRMACIIYQSNFMKDTSSQS